MPLLHVLSDLHIDTDGNDWQPPVDVAADVVVVSGDVCERAVAGLTWLREHFKDSTIIYTLGNHCFWSNGDPKKPELRTTWEHERERAAAMAGFLGIHLLDDSEVTIDRVRYLGGTLWTDFQCRPAYASFEDAERHARSRSGMMDYRKIKTGAGRSSDNFTPRDSIGAHKATRRFLRDALEKPVPGVHTTVVVTHHAPSPQSLEHGSVTSVGDCCYASDLANLLVGDDGVALPTAPDLWIHGHIHSGRDYEIGATRILANPRGYRNDIKHWAERGQRENPDFNERLVVEVGPTPALKLGM